MTAVLEKLELNNSCESSESNDDNFESEKPKGNLIEFPLTSKPIRHIRNFSGNDHSRSKKMTGY